MRDLHGLILLDENEIVIRIYMNENNKWVLIRYQSYDLTPFDKNKIISSTDIIEVIAQFSLSQDGRIVTYWKICARNLADMTVHDIANATGIPTELLTLNREQELLCKGILLEL